MRSKRCGKTSLKVVTMVFIFLLYIFHFFCTMLYTFWNGKKWNITYLPKLKIFSWLKETRHYLPYMQAWQHGSGATTKHPHSKKHNQKCGAKHHLPCISGSISNGQGKCHCTTKAYEGMEEVSSITHYQCELHKSREIRHFLNT